MVEPAAAPAATGAVLAQPGAFETCTDFSRINAVRHKGNRQNTFNTPRPLVDTMKSMGRTKSEQVRSDPRYPTKELMEVFEMGVARNLAVLRSEIREELRVSGEEMCREVTERISDIRHITLLEEMHKKADHIITGPVKVDFRDVFAEVSKSEVIVRDIVQGLEGQMSQNTDKVLLELRKVQAAQKEHSGKQERAREQTEEFRSHMQARFAENAQVAEERQSALLEQHRAASEEVQRLQQDTTTQHAKVNEANTRHSQEKKEFSRALKQAQSDVSRMASLQETMHTTAEETAEHARQMRQESLANRTSLEHHVSTQLEEQVAKIDVVSVLRHTKQTHQTLEVEFSQVYCELSRIQQALHVDFVNIMDLKARQSRSGHKKDSSRTDYSERGSMLLGDSDDHQIGRSRTIKRLRNFATQTHPRDCVDMGCQTEVQIKKDPKKDAKKKRETRRQTTLPVIMNQPKAPNRMFADHEAMKEKARQAIIRPPYNVFNFYDRRKWASTIAMSPIFEYFTMGMIMLNAIWLGFDADYNPAPVLVEAEPLFQIVEHIFCTFFSLELAVRFLAFKRKRNILQDFWFAFDTCLVFFMVTETWLMTLVLLTYGQGGAFFTDASMLRLLRIVKMMRVSRMARLLRGFPEVLVLLKGMKAAFRSVCIFFLLWAILIYIFALVFVTLSSGNFEEFRTVPTAMNTLLLDAILPQHGPVVKLVANRNYFYWLIMMTFIAIASVTLMNMLVGVLVEVVNLISTTEREGVEVMTLAQDLRQATSHLNISWSNMDPVAFREIVTDVNVATAVNSYGADPGALVDAAEAQFEELDRNDKSFGFEDFVELVLKMRGKNAAKVRDIKEQVNILKRCMHESTSEVVEEVSEGFMQLRVELRSVHEATMQRFNEDSECDGSDGDAD